MCANPSRNSIEEIQGPSCRPLDLILRGTQGPSFLYTLKVPNCEIFDRSDFPDFYTIKSLCEGDFGVKIIKKIKNI